jgi:hypothetical protein
MYFDARPTPRPDVGVMVKNISFNVREIPTSRSQSWRDKLWLFK